MPVLLTGPEFVRRQGEAEALAQAYIDRYRPGLQNETMKQILTAVAVVDTDLDGALMRPASSEPSPTAHDDERSGAELLLASLLQIGYEVEDPTTIRSDGLVSPRTYLYRILDYLYEGVERGGDDSGRYQEWLAAFRLVTPSTRLWYDLGVPVRDRIMFPYRFGETHPCRAPVERPALPLAGVSPSMHLDTSSPKGTVEHVITTREAAIEAPHSSEQPLSDSHELHDVPIAPDSLNKESDGEAEEDSDEVGASPGVVVMGVTADHLLDAIRGVSDGLPIIVRRLSIIGDLDLSGLRFEGEVRFEQCNFYKERPAPEPKIYIGADGRAEREEPAPEPQEPVIRANLIMEGTGGSSVTLDRCVLGDLMADGLDLSGNLRVLESELCTLYLNRAVVKGQVEFQSLGELAFERRLEPADICRDELDSYPVSVAAGDLRASSVTVRGGHFAVLRLVGCHIDQVLRLGLTDEPVRVTDWISISRARVQTFIAEGADIGPKGGTPGLWAFNARLGTVDVQSMCRIWGVADFSGSSVSGRMNLAARAIKTEDDHGSSTVDLSLSRIAGAVTLGLAVDPWEDAYETEVDNGRVSACRPTDRANWIGTVSLREARVDGDLKIGRLSLEARPDSDDPARRQAAMVSIDGTGLEVSGSLELASVDSAGRVVADGFRTDALSVTGCEIGKRLTTRASRRAFGPVIGDVEPPGLSLRSSLVTLKADMSGSRIFGDLCLAQASIRDLHLGCALVDGSPSRLTLIDGTLHAPGLVVTGECRIHADFEAAATEGEGNGAYEQGSLKEPPKDETAPFTRLTNATLGHVEFGPSYGQTGSGLVCLVGSDFGEIRPADAQAQPIDPWAATSQRKWPWRRREPAHEAKDVPSSLTARHEEEQRQIEFTRKLITAYSRRHFHPSPYVVAAQTQKALGRDVAAKGFRVLQKRDELAYGRLTRGERVRSQASYHLTRYGYSLVPLWSLLGLFALLALATVLAAAWLGLFIPTAVVSGSAGTVGIISECSATYPCFNWFVYLLDAVVPVANFQQTDFWQPVGWWIPTTLGIFTVSIWALSIFLIAAVSSHAKKNAE